MAMNNWGGVKEHMTKKPRRFFGHKKTARKSEFLAQAETNNRIDEQRANRKRSKAIVRELIYLLIVMLFTFCLMYFVLL